MILDMRIISAKFGLISPKKEIPNYDKRMDEKTAKKMKKEIKKKLKKISSESDYADILVVLGKDYLKAIEGIDEIFKNTGIKYADGRIGEKNRTLKLWMNNKLNKK